MSGSTHSVACHIPEDWTLQIFYSLSAVCLDTHIYWGYQSVVVNQETSVLKAWSRKCWK